MTVRHTETKQEIGIIFQNATVILFKEILKIFFGELKIRIIRKFKVHLNRVGNNSSLVFLAAFIMSILHPLLSLSLEGVQVQRPVIRQLVNVISCQSVGYDMQTIQYQILYLRYYYPDGQSVFQFCRRQPHFIACRPSLINESSTKTSVDC